MAEAISIGSFILGFFIGWVLIDKYLDRRQARKKQELLGIYSPWRKK